MGAGAVRARRTTRTAARKAKRTSASPAPAPTPPAPNQDITSGISSSEVDGDKDIAHPEPEAQPVPGKRPRATRKKAPAAASTTPTRVTQSRVALAGDILKPKGVARHDIDEHPLEQYAESTPKASARPKRNAKAEFMAMLSQIAEEPDFNEGDRTIGNYQWHDNEWQEWTLGGKVDGDEYEEDGMGDDDDLETSTTTSTVSRATGYASAPHIASAKPKCRPASNSKTKGGGKLKRKQDEDQEDSDSESDQDDGEFHFHLNIPCIDFEFCCPEEFSIPVDVSSKPKDICNVLTVSSKIQWEELAEQIACVLNVFRANLRAQYTLSTDRKGAIPIPLTSQADFNALHTWLASLINPGRNADGSRSRRKKKVVTVFVTDKNDNNSFSGGDSKVSK